MEKILLISKVSETAKQFYENLLRDFVDSDIKLVVWNMGENIADAVARVSAGCVLFESNLSECSELDLVENYLQEKHCVPIIVIGILGTEKNAIPVLKKGVYDYLIKEDLQAKTLYKTIRDAIEKAALVEKISEQESEMRYLVMHDRLTNIPNRRHFEGLAEKALSRARRMNRRFSIMIIDIDHFRTINETLGYAAGDLLLQKFTKRIFNIIRKNDVVARLGNDEFAVILDLLKDQGESEKIAQRILDAMQTTFQINGKDYVISVSIGIATYSEDGSIVSDLIKNADAALYIAKKEGRNTYRCYLPKYQQPFIEYLAIENAVHDALKKREFYLCYQPIFNNDKSLYAYETLLRWTSEKLSGFSPKQIILSAEESGLIHQLGEWVLINAIKNFAEYDKNDQIKMSINLSPVQLNEPDFLQTILRITKKYGVSPKNIILELTETAIISDHERIASIFRILRENGFGIFIDDFGTGYTSLNLIRNLPISGLKIDQSFVQHIDTNSVDFNMVKSILELAKNIGLIAVVEGVETQQQHDIIAAHTEAKIQGFFLGKPKDKLGG